MFVTSFTAILFSSQHFGTKPDLFNSFADSEFVGLTKDFSFDCPGVDSGETAVLMFQSIGVANKQTVLQIDGRDVNGPGLPIANASGFEGVLYREWSANTLLVPHHRLKVAGNILHVESTGIDFMIDNVVITYKIEIGPVKPPRKPPFQPFPTAIRKRKSPAKRSTRD